MAQYSPKEVTLKGVAAKGASIPIIWYYKVSNNHAANLILFLKKSFLHGLISSYMFIYF